MSDENDGDDLTACPVCETPVFSIVIRGPSPAERYAQPCGHRLPADFDDGNTNDEEAKAEEEEEVVINDWAGQLNERAGDGGGCLETAQAAASEREESRRGVVKGLSALLATFGLGAGATGTAAANPHAPGTPTPAASFHCTGRVDIECVKAAAGGTTGCYPCTRRPSHMTCVPCAGALILAETLGRTECCVGGKWVSSFDTR
jgi:hypothetical protein